MWHNSGAPPNQNSGKHDIVGYVNENEGIPLYTTEIEITPIVEDNAHNEEDLVLVPNTQLDAEPSQNKK